MTVSRRDLAAFTAFAVVILAWLFRDALVRGYVLGQADLLYQFPPWNGYAPSGWRPGNRWLLDSPTQSVPFLIYAREAVLAGRFPLWVSELGSGHPFFAAFQTAVLSPFSLIGYALPVPQALAPIAAARLLVGGIGMFVFLRTLRLGVAASTFGGVAFLLNAFSVGWLEHHVSSVAAWLPWALITTERCVRSPTGTAIVWSGVVTALALLSGHPETAFKVYLLAGAYALYVARSANRRWHGLAASAAGVLLGTLVCAIQLAPFLEYLSNSRIVAARASLEGPLFTNPPASFVTMFIPGFFGTPSDGRYVLSSSNYLEQQAYPGLLTWLLASVALASRRHRGLVLFFAAAAAASALIMYGTVVASLATTVLPPLRFAALSRFGLLVIVGLVIVASLGLDDLLERAAGTSKAPWILAAGAAVFIVVVVAAFMLVQRPLLEEGRQWFATRRSVDTAAALLLIALAGLWLTRIVSPRLSGLVAGAVIAVDLLVFASGLHPLRPSRDTYPATPELTRLQADPGVFRVAGWEDALYPNSVLAYGLHDYRNYDSIGVLHYEALLDVGFRFNRTFHALHHFATPHLLDLLNIKYVVTPPDVEAPRDRFTLIEDGRSRLYRNDRVLPRAFLVDGWIRLEGDDARRALRNGSIDLRRTVVLERDLPPPQLVTPAESAPGVARLVRYEDERVVIETAADGPRLLVLTDTDYPGWAATVDGVPAEIHRADYAFRAVFVAAGRHTVEFRYRPLSFRVGAGLSAVGLLVATVILVSGRRRHAALIP